MFQTALKYNLEVTQTRRVDFCCCNPANMAQSTFLFPYSGKYDKVSIFYLSEGENQYEWYHRSVQRQECCSCFI